MGVTTAADFVGVGHHLMDNTSDPAVARIRKETMKAALDYIGAFCDAWERAFNSARVTPPPDVIAWLGDTRALRDELVSLTSALDAAVEATPPIDPALKAQANRLATLRLKLDAFRSPSNTSVDALDTLSSQLADARKSPEALAAWLAAAERNEASNALVNARRAGSAAGSHLPSYGQSFTSALDGLVPELQKEVALNNQKVEGDRAKEFITKWKDLQSAWDESISNHFPFGDTEHAAHPVTAEAFTAVFGPQAGKLALALKAARGCQGVDQNVTWLKDRMKDAEPFFRTGTAELQPLIVTLNVEQGTIVGQPDLKITTVTINASGSSYLWLEATPGPRDLTLDLFSHVHDTTDVTVTFDGVPSALSAFLGEPLKKVALLPLTLKTNKLLAVSRPWSALVLFRGSTLSASDFSGQQSISISGPIGGIGNAQTSRGDLKVSINGHMLEYYMRLLDHGMPSPPTDLDEAAITCGVGGP